MHHSLVHDSLGHQGEARKSPFPGEKGDHDNSSDNEHGNQGCYHTTENDKLVSIGPSKNTPQLTVFPLVVGPSVQTERKQDQTESESEQNETESIDPSPVEDHPRPNSSGGTLALNLFTEPQVRSGDGDGYRHRQVSQLARMR